MSVLRNNFVFIGTREQFENYGRKDGFIFVDDNDTYAVINDIEYKLGFTYYNTMIINRVQNNYFEIE